MKLSYPIKELKSLKVIQISDQPIYVSQGFGENPQIYARFNMKGHNGLDIAASAGTPILAPHDGRVTYQPDIDGYGNTVWMHFDEDGFTWELVFGHLSRFEGKNRSVKQGEVIGYVGTTGFSTGNHLHLGVRKLIKGKVQDYNNGYFGYVDTVPFLHKIFMNEHVKIINYKGTIFIGVGAKDIPQAIALGEAFGKPVQTNDKGEITNADIVIN